MYLYSIPQNTGKTINKLFGKQTKLRKQNLKTNKTKKLSRSELNGGFLGIDLCKWGGRCHMPKLIYKAIKVELTKEFLTLFNVKKENDDYKTKYEKIIERGLDDGLLRGFLHGVYAKIGPNRKYLESPDYKYLDNIKIFMKLLILSGMPEANATYPFPSSYGKYNSDGKQIDEMGTVTNSNINIDRTTISGDVLLSYIEKILRADKDNLQVSKLLQKPEDFIKHNKFIFPDFIDSKITKDISKKFCLNQVMYFYNTTACIINERGNVQSTDNCKVVFTFNTKQSVSVATREITKTDFTYVESNLKQIRAYFLSLGATSDKKKINRYIDKLIPLLSDSYKIKHYIDGCIKFFSYMERFKSSQNAQAGLYPDKSAVV